MKKTLLFSLQQDITKLICDRMEAGQMLPERAALIAQFILNTLPDNMSDEHLLKILPSLDDEFIELSGIVHKYLSEYEKEYTGKITDITLNLIRNDKLDEANQLVQEYFRKKNILT